MIWPGPKITNAFFFFKTVGNIFKLWWDIVVDWGLFNGTKPETKWLRDEMKFSPKLYYFAMIWDVFALFFWVISAEILKKFVPVPTEDGLCTPDDRIHFYVGVSIVIWLEMINLAIRRSLWVLLRVESEYFNNYESYRDICTIPPIIADT